MDIETAGDQLLIKENNWNEWFLESCCCLRTNKTGIKENFTYPPFCAFSSYLCFHVVNPLCLYISCCNLPFKSDVPKTVIWLGDVTTIGGLKYGEWKALSSVFYYSCCISATLNKETIQTYCYTGIYTCCLNFILQCIICPPLTIPWNYWNGSLLLTSLK